MAAGEIDELFWQLRLCDLWEAEQLLRLRQSLPGHGSLFSDLVAIGRGLGWSVAQLGVFVVYLNHVNAGG